MIKNALLISLFFIGIFAVNSQAQSPINYAKLDSGSTSDNSPRLYAQNDKSFSSESKPSSVNSDIRNYLIASEKNPASAFIYSFIMPGLGQMYNGKVGKGFNLLGGYLCGGVLLGMSSGDNKTAFTIAGAALMGFSWLYAIIDAPIDASNINDANELKRAQLLQRAMEKGAIGLSLSSAELDIAPTVNKNGGYGLNMSIDF